MPNSNDQSARDTEQTIPNRSLGNRSANCISNGDAVALSWETASENAQKWWIELEKANSERPDLVRKLAYELRQRDASLEDFYLICSYSNRLGVTENLKCLDRAKQDFHQ